MESLNPKLALYESETLCTRIDIVFYPLYEVSDGAISLRNSCPSLHLVFLITEFNILFWGNGVWEFGIQGMHYPLKRKKRTLNT